MNGVLGRDHVELDQKIGEIDLLGPLIDDDPHGAVLRMGAKVDHRPVEAAVAHARHGDEKLAVEIGRLAESPAKRCLISFAILCPVPAQPQAGRNRAGLRHVLRSRSVQTHDGQRPSTIPSGDRDA